MAEPVNSSFSFKVPLRRVSLALPSSEAPKLGERWEFRDDTALQRKEKEKEKKPRNKWTMEETQMLVDGCNLHGVGNWKAILKDPNLKFDNRSPVDLKDRFRTYFPDAYKLHYPNAKTHLSTKVRSTLPDGSPLFEKTRSKKRRPFTEEEDRALKAGYEKHGTLWAAIAKDPIFQEQNRRSTDLRDRFRNAFPDLYLKAGYKPRSNPKKLIRAATDDQVGMSSTGPRRKRRNTSQGLLRGGTKSVPQSTAPSEDEDSDDEFLASKNQMDLDLDSDTRSQAWSVPSVLDTPTHSSIQAWSPTSSHISADNFLNSSHSSPFQSRDMGAMIGKSAWGTNDWFSANPRLDSSSSSLASSSSINSSSLSLLDSIDNPPSSLSLSPTPSSPFSFNALNHGVLDRYDLVPTSFSFSHLGHEFGSASEVGLGDTQSTFSDDIGMHQPFRGFTHHSNYAGDLIFGARTHQPMQPFSLGLGLSGMQEIASGIHPLQLHTPALPLAGIDELELAGINLNDAAPNDILLEQPVDSQQLEPLTLDDLVDLDLSLPEAYITPPGTPLSQPPQRQMRSMRTRSVNLNSGSFRFDTSSLQARSISVPPGEDRDRVVRPSNPPPSAFPAHFLTPLVRDVNLPHQALDPPTSDLYNLPFLDLHYNAHSSAEVNNAAAITTGQALDLASSTRATPPQQSNSSILFEGRGHHHQRGQSAVVCPQDLSMRSKRKRTSWDGGHG